MFPGGKRLLKQNHFPQCCSLKCLSFSGVQFCNSCERFDGSICHGGMKSCWKFNLYSKNRSCATDHYYFSDLTTGRWWGVVLQRDTKYHQWCPQCLEPSCGGNLESWERVGSGIHHTQTWVQGPVWEADVFCLVVARERQTKCRHSLGA